MSEVIKYSAKDPKYAALTNIVPATIVLNIGKKGEKVPKVLINANAAYTFLCEKDADKRELIVRCLSVKNANYYASAASGFEEPDEETRLKYMRRILRAKFVNGHPYFTKLLLSTGTAELQENRYWEKSDSFWGIAKDNTGENHMGKILMELREELREGLRGKRTAKKPVAEKKPVKKTTTGRKPRRK